MANPVAEQSTKWNASLDGMQYIEYVATCNKLKVATTPWIALINAHTQMMHVCNQKTWIHYPISTSEKGLGQEENTGKTPTGLHKVEEKIGEKAQPLEIFESRLSTGKLAEENTPPGKIVGRIFRLKGLEEGFNLGKNEKGICVDTFDRYVYIHGTNVLNEIGQAKSGGCIRMHPKDAIDLYEKLPVGSHVYIYG